MSNDDYDDQPPYVDSHADLVERLGALETLMAELIKTLQAEPALDRNYKRLLRATTDKSGREP